MDVHRHFILLPSFLFFRARAHAYKHGSAKVGVSKAKAKTFDTLAWIPVAVVALVAVGTLLSLSFFPGNAQKYANILVPADDEFTQDIQEVNYDEIPLSTAIRPCFFGHRTMGSMSDLVSQFEIAPTYSQINYQNHPGAREPAWLRADLFKWLQNREQGIPTYVIVDMTSQDAQVVRLDSEHAIKYSSEPLARNIDRYVQLKYPLLYVRREVVRDRR